MQDLPHWNKKSVQIIPWWAQETQLCDTNFVFGTHINFQEPSQHETSVSTTVIKCFLWFRFLVRLRAEFWLAFREVSIVLFGLLGIFCDLWLVKKISRHFLNQSDLMRKTTLTFSCAFPLSMPASCFHLELWFVHLNGCLHSLVIRQYYNCSLVLEELLMFCFILQWSSESKETIWDWFRQAGICSVTGNKLHCIDW